MNDQDWLAERFEANRSHLRGVAYRMLGSLAEADDAVQEAWIRLSRSDTSQVDNLQAWLTTVVARISLNVLRSRKTRRRTVPGDPSPGSDPESGAGNRSRAGSLAGRFGRARVACRPRLPDASRTGRLRAPRRLRRAVRRDRTDRRQVSDGGAAAGEPCPSSRPRCARARRRSRGPGPSSTPSSRRRAPVTSNACSPCWIRTSCSAPMVGRRDPTW